MSNKNEITGDTIITKPVKKEYAENYEAIFGHKCAKCSQRVRNNKLDSPCLEFDCPEEK